MDLIMNLNFRFGPLSRRTLRSVVRAIGPIEIGIEGLDESVVDQLEVQLRRFPRIHRLGFVLGLSFLEWGGPLGVWGLKPFSMLSRDQATGRLYLLLKSRFKPVSHLVNGLRILVCLSVYGRTDVEQWFGFERRRWRDQRIQLRARLLDVNNEEIQNDEYAYRRVFGDSLELPPLPEALYVSSDEAKNPLLSWESHHQADSPFDVSNYLEGRDNSESEDGYDDQP